MAKSEKLLLLLAVLLTIVAVAFWSVNLTAKDKQPTTVNDNQNQVAPGEDIGFNGNPSFTDENLEVLPNFALSLSSSQVNEVNVALDGDTLNVRSAEAIVMYDPSVAKITSITQGELFDLYITTDLDEEVMTDENGMAYFSIAASFAGDELPAVMTDGVMGSFTYESLSEAPVTFTLVQFDDDAEYYSKVITEDGQSYTIKENSISL
ncbi:hypothetical protein KC669_00820 [Candidatus Dojkabacteria bacterium]|uniref:Cohesin domain-containing protein n=1 Tax=Candidatus Dojkabacteria bacterium TaxID=2099670 RepID=A0A955L9H8_9BACT|nr:hypothetical protein [Candidatus Dojkabacteria bacterium]